MMNQPTTPASQISLAASSVIAQVPRSQRARTRLPGNRCRRAMKSRESSRRFGPERKRHRTTDHQEIIVGSALIVGHDGLIMQAQVVAAIAGKRLRRQHLMHLHPPDHGVAGEPLADPLQRDGSNL